jgi:putative transposase
LYCFFAIEHGRRHILQFNATLHPTSEWIMQQLREAFPLPCPYQYVVFDHDAKFGNEVLRFLQSSGLKAARTSIRSPWQNGTAERWVGNVRRELLDHIIPLDEFHLRRLGRDYLTYYHDDRTHIALQKATPSNRAMNDAQVRDLRLFVRLAWVVFITATLGQKQHDSFGHNFEDLQAIPTVYLRDNSDV